MPAIELWICVPLFNSAMLRLNGCFTIRRLIASTCCSSCRSGHRPVPVSTAARGLHTRAPLHLLPLPQVITELLDRAPISAKQRLRLDGCITDLSDVVGGCQRILNTPIPVSYTR